MTRTAVTNINRETKATQGWERADSCSELTTDSSDQQTLAVTRHDNPELSMLKAHPERWPGVVSSHRIPPGIREPGVHARAFVHVCLVHSSVERVASPPCNAAYDDPYRRAHRIWLAAQPTA